MLSNDELNSALDLNQFPRSARYDLAWQIENAMGPNALWLAESLSNKIDIQPSSKVLDLGCGKALSSVFLAREFECEVWAADLWIDEADNRQRIQQQGMEQVIHPVHAEAHDLPFEPGFFDYIVSFDAYHYFGTDDLYIGYITRFLKRGGRIGIVSPGLVNEFDGDPPAHLQPGWYWDMWSFHSANWWRNHINKTGRVRVDGAGMIADGWKQWNQWNDVCDRHRGVENDEGAWVAEDAGRNLGFVWWAATKPDDPAEERWRS